MALDINVMLRKAADGDVTVTESGVAVETGADLVAQTYMLFVPEAVAAGDTLSVVITEGDGVGPLTPFLAFPPITGAMTFPLQLFATGKSSLIMRSFTATSAGVAPNWGPVLVALTPAGRYENH